MKTTKKVSLADLLVIIKQFKGQVSTWQRRLQQAFPIKITPHVESEDEYNIQTDYSWKECIEQIQKLGSYLTYLRKVRNDNSADQIVMTYEIAELKSYISNLEGIHLNKKHNVRTKEGYEEKVSWNPVNKKEIDAMIEQAQTKFNALQSEITKYNNTSYVEIEEYEA